MPEIPVNTPLGYLGVFFMLFGFFLLIAGTGVISVKEISVTPGRFTLLMGTVLILFGFIFLFPTINETMKALSPTLTSTVTALPTQSIATDTAPPPVLVVTATFSEVSLQVVSTAIDTPTALVAASSTSDPDSIPCANSSKQLEVNQYALVATQIDNLLLRNNPGNTSSYIERMPPQTRILVIEGPVCAIYKGTFFWWWKVQSPSGKIGWIPEGFDARDAIFVKLAR